MPKWALKKEIAWLLEENGMKTCFYWKSWWHGITAITCPLPQQVVTMTLWGSATLPAERVPRACHKPIAFLKSFWHQWYLRYLGIIDHALHLQIFETIISIGRRHSLIIHGDISNSRPAKSLEILPVQILNRQTIAELPNDLHPMVKPLIHTLGSKKYAETSAEVTIFGLLYVLKGIQPCPNPQQKWIQPTSTILPPKFGQNSVKNYWFQRLAPSPSAPLKTFLSVSLKDPFDRVTLRCQSVFSSSAFASRHEGSCGTGGLPFSSCWHQPFWRILYSQIGSFPESMGKTKNHRNHNLVLGNGLNSLLIQVKASVQGCSYSNAILQGFIHARRWKMFVSNSPTPMSMGEYDHPFYKHNYDSTFLRQSIICS